MALVQRFGSDPDALSKKSDQTRFRPADKSAMRRPWSGIRRRRFLVGLVALVIVFFFVKNIPTDVPPVGQRYNQYYGSMATGHTKSQPGVLEKGEADKHTNTGDGYYEGAIRFNNLAASLRSFAASASDSNVVFGLTESRSVTTLLPFACQMALNGRNTVHIVLMSRQEATIDQIMAANKIGLDNCPVAWHDATPDYAERSTLARLHTSVQQALPYIHAALRPQALLVDDVSGYDPSLMTLIKTTVAGFGFPVIALPHHALDNLRWITTLDSHSIRKIGEVQIEILIQPYSETAGSLIRLLKSIRNADYAGLSMPRLTIELPARSDPILTAYLSWFAWPPGAMTKDNQLTIRKRIDTHQITPANATLRMVESFYPLTPSTSHVLVLSPEVELDPQYMHYLIFTLLEYKYAARANEWTQNLVGVSLELPTSSLDDARPFPKSDLTNAGLLQIQTPNSNAALYFGDKWVEFHNFLSKRLAADPYLGRDETAEFPTASRQHPQWLAQMLELMTAQGYTMLFPAFAHNPKRSIAVVHAELQHAPEEFAKSTDDGTIVQSAYITQIMNGEGLGENSAAREDTSIVKSVASSQPVSVLMSMTDKVPGMGGLPPLYAIPLLDFTGEKTDPDRAVKLARGFKDRFAHRVGGCPASNDRSTTRTGTIDELFCDPG